MIKKQLLPNLCYFLCVMTITVYSSATLALPNGLNFGALLARANTSYSASNQKLSPASKDEDSFAWRVFGGYKYNPNLALEFGYIQWPDTTFKGVLGSAGGSVDITQKSVDVMGKFIYPFLSAASVYAEAGVTYIKANKDANRIAKFVGVGLSDANTFRPVMGIGGNYEFYPNMLVDVAWIRVPAGSGIETSNFFGAGITFFVG